MYDLDPMNIALRSIALAVVFLFLTFLFRERVTIEGFWGYFLLFLVVIPINVLGGQAGHLARLPTDNPWVFLGIIAPLDVAALLFWNKFLPGLTTTSWRVLTLVALLLALLAFGLYLVPPIDFARYFPVMNRE